MLFVDADRIPTLEAKPFVFTTQQRVKFVKNEPFLRNYRQTGINIRSTPLGTIYEILKYDRTV